MVFAFLETGMEEFGGEGIAVGYEGCECFCRSLFSLFVLMVVPPTDRAWRRCAPVDSSCGLLLRHESAGLDTMLDAELLSRTYKAMEAEKSLDWFCVLVIVHAMIDSTSRQPGPRHC